MRLTGKWGVSRMNMFFRLLNKIIDFDFDFNKNKQNLFHFLYTGDKITLLAYLWNCGILPLFCFRFISLSQKYNMLQSGWKYWYANRIEQSVDCEERIFIVDIDSVWSETRVERYCCEIDIENRAYNWIPILGSQFWMLNLHMAGPNGIAI